MRHADDHNEICLLCLLLRAFASFRRLTSFSRFAQVRKTSHAALLVLLEQELIDKREYKCYFYCRDSVKILPVAGRFVSTNHKNLSICKEKACSDVFFGFCTSSIFHAQSTKPSLVDWLPEERTSLASSVHAVLFAGSARVHTSECSCCCFCPDDNTFSKRRAEILCRFAGDMEEQVCPVIMVLSSTDSMDDFRTEAVAVRKHIIALCSRGTPKHKDLSEVSTNNPFTVLWKLLQDTFDIHHCRCVGTSTRQGDPGTWE